MSRARASSLHPWNVWMPARGHVPPWRIGYLVNANVSYTARGDVADRRLRKALSSQIGLEVLAARVQPATWPLVHIRYVQRGGRVYHVLPPLFPFYDLRADPEMARDASTSERPIMYIQPELVHAEAVVFQGGLSPAEPVPLPISLEELREHPAISVALDHYLEYGRPLRQ